MATKKPTQEITHEQLKALHVSLLYLVRDITDYVRAYDMGKHKPSVLKELRLLIQKNAASVLALPAAYDERLARKAMVRLAEIQHLNETLADTIEARNEAIELALQSEREVTAAKQRTEQAVAALYKREEEIKKLQRKCARLERKK